MLADNRPEKATAVVDAPSPERKRGAISGGGCAGLTTAHALRHADAEVSRRGYRVPRPPPCVYVPTPELPTPTSAAGLATSSSLCADQSRVKPGPARDTARISPNISEMVCSASLIPTLAEYTRP